MVQVEVVRVVFDVSAVVRRCRAWSAIQQTDLEVPSYQTCQVSGSSLPRLLQSVIRNKLLLNAI